MGTDIRPELSKKNQYYISKHRYYELKHFCLQYKDYKRIYNDICNRLPSGIYKISETPKEDGSLYVRLKYLNKINLIEDSIKRLDPVLGNYILKAVTEGYSYTTLKTKYNIPCGKDMYYELYRRFFYILDKKLA